MQGKFHVGQTPIVGKNKCPKPLHTFKEIDDGALTTMKIPRLFQCKRCDEMVAFSERGHGALV